MQRWTILVLAGVLVIAVAYIGLRSAPPAPAAAPGAAALSPTPELGPAPLDEGPKDAGAARDDVPPDTTRPEGIPLPESAPKQVSFGVILFTYAGAEFAPKTARARTEALELARQTLPLAREDFAEAAKRGDPGSTRDAGRIPQGILEAHVEYALFTLEKNAVHGEPLDTPRGYWIVRRND
jgi:hypothetical protein